MKIHHIGYLVKNIQAGKKAFENLGFSTETEIINDVDRMIRILFMINENYRIELIEPINSESYFYGLLKKYKNTGNHLCYQVADIQEKIKELTKAGYIILQEPAVAVAIEKKKVAFLIHPNMGIIELLEIEEV